MISLTLEDFEIQGKEFLREQNNHVNTRFLVKTRAFRENIVFPKQGVNFWAEKKAYVEKYGPYSRGQFDSLMLESINNFEQSKMQKLGTERGIIRRLWILKQLYELFDVSMGMLIATKPNLFSIAITKALEVLREPMIDAILEDRKQSGLMKRIIHRSLYIIEKVYTKMARIATDDTKILKLMPTNTMLLLVEVASHQMVSKFRRLPWINPVLAKRVAPKFNSFWSNFWFEILKRNLTLHHDICFVIAEFMPMNFKKESFLDFFRRKYSTQTQEFFGERIFDVEEAGNFIRVIFN